MRAPDEIERRLKKLTSRYKDKYLSKSQGRFHKSCAHNRTHVPTPTVKSESSKMWESSLSPRRQVTLIVMQPEMPVGICMYGSEKPETWNGNTCDDDSVSEECPYFTPSQSKEDASAEFDMMLKDDALVLSEYPDVAALQWVLQARSWDLPEYERTDEQTAKNAAELLTANAEIKKFSQLFVEKREELESLRFELEDLRSRPPPTIAALFGSWIGSLLNRLRGHPSKALTNGRNDDPPKDP